MTTQAPALLAAKTGVSWTSGLADLAAMLGGVADSSLAAQGGSPRAMIDTFESLKRVIRAMDAAMLAS